jgi:WhiB family redox-sensing transcriptional regulator
MEGDWMRDAVCRGMDPNLFMPERGDYWTMQAAKAVCAGCPVKEPCLELGMYEKFGIWGGMTEKDRRRLRRQRSRRVAA